MTTRFDVAVLGLGPAGRATAAACAQVGLSVVALDPAPHRRWRVTYGAWTDELTPAVPEAMRVQRPVAWTTRRHEIARPYSVLDTAALQDSLVLDGVDVRAARAVDATAGTVGCADGAAVRARLVLDARGARMAGRAQQTAYGVVLDRRRAEQVLQGADGVFMDWRPLHGAGLGAPASFLYAVPLDAERVLVEETCLAGRPAVSVAALRGRLEHRLAAHGVRLHGDEPVERVRFALDTPLPVAEWFGRLPAVPRLGAAAPLVHPASGYSVAAALRLAPAVAAAAASEGPARGVQRLLWPRSVRAVHALRLHGLRMILALAPEQVPEFFAAFLELPGYHQRAYLSGRDHPLATAAAMTALLPQLSWPLRTALLSTRAGALVRR